MKNKTICAISYQEIPTERLGHVRQELVQEVIAALEEGYTTFITEYGTDVGTLFARCAIDQREKYPDIYLELVLYKLDEPLDGDIFLKANGIKPLCDDCRESYPLSATRYLVEQSDRVIIVSEKANNPDIAYAMDYTRTMERDCRIIEI
jgi:hypothetical protein